MNIRDLRREDSAVLEELLDKMSPASRYLRFHTAVSGLNGSLLRGLLDLDPLHHVAVVAQSDDGVLGVARLIRDRHRSREAEVSVAVADAHHRRGVGRELLRALVGRAPGMGIDRMRAWIIPGNTPAISLFRAVFPLCLTRHGAGALELVGLLDAQPWEITMEDVLSELLS
jgi:L-amino acid N-acyltransferase YncA